MKLERLQLDLTWGCFEVISPQKCFIIKTNVMSTLNWDHSFILKYTAQVGICQDRNLTFNCVQLVMKLVRSVNNSCCFWQRICCECSRVMWKIFTWLKHTLFFLPFSPPFTSHFSSVTSINNTRVHPSTHGRNLVPIMKHWTCADRNKTEADSYGTYPQWKETHFLLGRDTELVMQTCQHGHVPIVWILALS